MGPDYTGIAGVRVMAGSGPGRAGLVMTIRDVASTGRGDGVYAVRHVVDAQQVASEQSRGFHGRV